MNKNVIKKTMTVEEIDSFLKTLEIRFQKNINRHKGIKWSGVLKKLKAKKAKLQSLYEMERTGGEPDVVGVDKKTGGYIFFDCAEESPKGRRSTCYDEVARKARKEHPPENSAVGMAAAMGVELLSEDEYRKLQKLGKFDMKTSSWIATPPAIRKLGGAVFCDRRYETVFLYHNGADSYYASRGFRCSLRV